MNHVFQLVESLALVMIVGGGFIMASSVRPFLLPILRRSESPDLVAAVESISIRSWNRYNRFALVSTVIVSVVEAWRVATASLPLWHVALPVLMLFALIGKLLIDRRLVVRLKQRGANAVGSTEQKTGHRTVELLSIFVMVIAVVLIAIPY